MSDYVWTEEQKGKFNAGLQMDEKTFNEKFPESEQSASAPVDSPSTGSVSNFEYAKDSARRAADADYDFDKQNVTGEPSRKKA